MTVREQRKATRKPPSHINLNGREKRFHRQKPRAAPEEMPRRKGSERGFLSVSWRVAPEPARNAPEERAPRVLVSLSFHISSRNSPEGEKRGL